MLYSYCSIPTGSVRTITTNRTKYSLKIDSSSIKFDRSENKFERIILRFHPESFFTEEFCSLPLAPTARFYWAFVWINMFTTLYSRTVAVRCVTTFCVNPTKTRINQLAVYWQKSNLASRLSQWFTKNNK